MLEDVRVFLLYSSINHGTLVCIPSSCPATPMGLQALWDCLSDDTSRLRCTFKTKLSSAATRPSGLCFPARKMVPSICSSRRTCLRMVRWSPPAVRSPTISIAWKKVRHSSFSSPIQYELDTVRRRGDRHSWSVWQYHV